MTKEKLNANDKQNNELSEVIKKKVTLELDIPANTEYVICKMCGHANLKNVGICVMCSNYLFN